MSGYEEGENVPVGLKLKGEELPEKVYLVSTQGKFLMRKTSKIESFYTLKNLKENTVFHFEANGFVSEEYNLSVVPKSAIGRFEASLHFPGYLGKKDVKVANAGDLEVPEGTSIEWSILTKNTSEVAVLWNEAIQRFNEKGFKFSKKFTKSSDMKVFLTNAATLKKDSASYNISVIKDAFPTIEVKESVDSISDAIRFFEGQIGDDYGLNTLSFYYQIVSEKGIKSEKKVSVVRTSGTEMSFTFACDFRRELLEVKDKIEYYFIVSDNDGVNGSKSVRSQMFIYQLPSLSELNEKRDDAQDQSKKELSELLKRTKEFQKDVSKLKKEVLNTKSNEWNKLNQLNQLKEEQQSLEKALEQMQSKMNESMDEKNQLSELDPELIEKQELLDKLLDEVMDDELLDLLKQLEELMKAPDKNQLNQKMEQLEVKSEDMKKQLDRTLEMLKKLQVNEKLDDIQKELNELSAEQKELKEDIKSEKLDSKTGQEKQSEINKKFDEIKEDLKKLDELNKALDKPLNLGDQEEVKESITNDLKEAKENLEKNKEKKAGDNQQKSSEEMKKLADELEMMQSAANKKQEEEDINLLRAILESLMTLSFTQEETMMRFGKVKDNDPFYRKLGRVQRNIIDDTKIVADSLDALAKRQPKIASFIDKELNDIDKNFGLSLEDIDEHRRRELGQHLQFVMTAYNNLALMLNESLQNMQSQMQSEMPGSGSCDKPGGKGSKPKSGGYSGDMKEMLKKQLEQMKKGNNPGGKSPGDKEGEGGQGMQGLGNKEIAKMAAQQTAIRQRLEQMRNEMNKEGKGLGNKLNPLINELEQQEKDLINKRFSKEMIKRQQDILSRLLESEKALMERGFEEKRESKSGNSFNYSNQKRIDEYNQQKLKQVELLRSVDPMYRKYYRDKASEYFNAVL